MAIQVYEVTHDGQGNPLSRVFKQFISFTYGGKAIEDFNLLVTFSSERLTKGIYSSFSDSTTTNVGIDGQMFWLTQFDPLTIHFDLSTDGMSTRDLENFKTTFYPGIARELILSEYPNRGILARVAAAPQMEVLPFEDLKTIKIAGKDYTIESSLYKGSISLDLICDDPYWYAIQSSYEETDLTNDEALKSIGDDGIPCTTMFSDVGIVIGNGKEVGE